MTKFTPLSTYVFNVAVGAAYTWATAWVSWSTWSFAFQGEDVAALLNAIALVFWGGRLGEFYFEVFHGPARPRGGETLRAQATQGMAPCWNHHLPGAGHTVLPGTLVSLNPHPPPAGFVPRYDESEPSWRNRCGTVHGRNVCSSG